MDKEATLRFECLRLAINHGNSDVKNTLSRAKAYFEFTLAGLTATEQPEVPQRKY